VVPTHLVSPGHRQPQPAPQGPLPIRGLIIAVEGDGGRVIVQFVQIDGQLADRVDNDRQGQSRDVGVEEAVKAPTDAIVVERGQLSTAQLVEMRCHTEMCLAPRRIPCQCSTALNDVSETSTALKVRKKGAGDTILAS
jgi:hypothetical protein